MKRYTFAAVVACTCLGLSIMASAEDRAESVGIQLGRYTVTRGPKVIDNVSDNMSGLTFSPTTRTLFAAINNPTQAVELGLDGSFKRIIGLMWFEDTEGLVWMTDSKFAILEERRRCLVLVDLNAETKTVDRNKCERFEIDPNKARNRGTEGVAYDPASKKFYVVKEKDPRKLYKMVLPAEEAKTKALANPDEEPPVPEITLPWDIDTKSLGMDDLSGICFDPKSGHLLILSDESKCVVEATLDGKEISRLSLKGGSAGLSDTIKQPEGITLDDRGNLYVCSEPNTLYVFSKPPEPANAAE